MTTEEFKKKYPSLAHLQGNELWNAMEDKMIEEGNFTIGGMEEFKNFCKSDKPFDIEKAEKAFFIPTNNGWILQRFNKINNMEINSRILLPMLLSYLKLPPIACEIGTAEGRFAKDLLLSGIKKLYCVDYWGYLETASGDGKHQQEWHDNNYKEAKERVEQFGDRAILLKGLSKEMAKEIPDNSLGMIYVDCDHSYENVMQDLKTYTPKLVKGGVIAGHDIGNPAYGVAKAVEEFANAIKSEIHIIPEDEELNSSYWFLKTEYWYNPELLKLFKP